MDELAVLLNNELIGTVERKRGGLLEFRYDPSWQDNPLAYPLSLSMPLAKRVHDNSVIRPFVEGLLPDNAAVLASWARTFHVSANNPFSMLSHVGEDCAGAVQFVPFDNLEDLRNAEHRIEWLTDEDVADRLRAAIQRDGTGRLGGDHGQFSLAGVQPKTALYFDGSRWGIPTGSIPTTHILKPPAQAEFDAFDINEHFCLELAGELGLAAVHSGVRAFGDQQALVVERYDRSPFLGGPVQRVHQEDCCQALGVLPAYKYEADGGPSISTLFNLLFERSTERATDVGALIDAVTLNWVIGGSDAHAKNYSILLGPRTVRLAPLYDVISALPYMHIRDVKLAMRVGREYHAWKIALRHWERLALECALDVEPLVGRVAELVADVPSASERAASRVRASGVSHEIVDRLEESISLRATELAGILA